MPIIKYQFNFGNVYLTSGGLAQSTTSIFKDSVRCTTREGEQISLPFKGFTSIFRMRQFENVTVHNVKAIKSGNCVFGGGDWHDIKGEHVGICVDGGLYLVLGDRGLPVVDDDYMKPKEREPGQVVYMSEFRGN
ncbi:hypothetical protein [Pseudoalteromonas umbrosa]|uniref:hypothetical protein n=1 Tax=Pseudoalteromonas umbrosa TaxID=3048489 RepID=UPI0024C3258A|nr:hypothetical protein [Pseudoalteromonas sp. B95]MDK1289833.1 hypothetical protein [Pseudoalteromonas sp. B95]